MIAMPGRSLAYGYFALASLGLLVPHATVLPRLGTHGIDPRAILGELFSTRIGAFGLEVIVSAVVLYIAAGALWWWRVAIAFPVDRIAGLRVHWHAAAIRRRDVVNLASAAFAAAIRAHA